MTRVFVVEDERALLEEIVDVLTMEGMEVACASSGTDAITEIPAFMPDVIVCDITMPGMDGYQVLETLQQQESTATTPFIFLTARADRDSMRQGMELGADDYLPKPFTITELLTAIETRLAKHDALRELPNGLSDTVQANLTPREIEVLRLVAQGLTSREIGAELSISYRTVETHRKHIMTKTHLQTQADLIRYALQHGVTEL